MEGYRLKIKFLGTAAAEGWPGIFCECDVCMKARELKGKNIRTRSSCIIDDKYMVDFPPDTYMHVLNNGLMLSKIEYLFITHSHSDHFYPEDLELRKNWYAVINSVPTLNIYGSKRVGEKFDAVNEGGDRTPLKFNTVLPFTPFIAGDAKVTPFLADHMKDEDCYIYTIEINNKTLLYGHDTGYFPEKTWEALKGKSIDGAIFDCTFGPIENSRGHMGFPNVLEVKKRLIEEGITNKDTKYIVTHFSHNCGMLHEDLVKMAAPHDIIVTYDGLEVEI